MLALLKLLLPAITLYALADASCYGSNDDTNLPCQCVSQGQGSCNANVYWDHIVTSQGTGTIELFDYKCNRIGRADQTVEGDAVDSQLPYTFDMLIQTAAYEKNQATGQWQWPITPLFSALYAGHGVASPALGGSCWCGEWCQVHIMVLCDSR